MAWTDPDGKTIYIDNVLCYIQNKVTILDADTIVSLCDPVFEATEIEAAKKKLFDLCHEESDKTEDKTRIGKHKIASYIRDIYALLHEKGNSAPVFVAQDVNRLPPVTIKHLDMSIILSENKALRAEVKVMKEAMELQKKSNDDLMQMMKMLSTRMDELEGRSNGQVNLPNVSIHEQTKHTENVLNLNGISDDFLRLPTTQAELDPKAQPFDHAKSNGAKNSYANIASLNHPRDNGLVVDEDGFVLCGPNGKPLRRARPVTNFPHVQNVKRKNQGVIGKSSRNDVSVATRTLKANVFATRFTPDTTPEEVKDILKEDERLKDMNINVEKVNTKYNTYASFHITCVCLETEAKLFFEPEVWPNNIFIRPWKEKKSNRNQGNNGFSGHYSIPPRWMY